MFNNVRNIDIHRLENKEIVCFSSCGQKCFAFNCVQIKIASIRWTKNKRIIKKQKTHTKSYIEKWTLNEFVWFHDFCYHQNQMWSTELYIREQI